MGAFGSNFPNFRAIWLGTTKPKLQNRYGAADQNIQTFISNLDLGYLVEIWNKQSRFEELVARITVTLSIFNFSTWFFKQIVENRKTQLSSPFLGPGDNFSKSYDENRFRKVAPALNRARGIWCMITQTSDAIQLPYKSVFVITFRKNVPRTKNRLESCVSRFSTICAKNLVLKLKMDKVTVIRATKSPFVAGLPCNRRYTSI